MKKFLMSAICLALALLMAMSMISCSKTGSGTGASQEPAKTQEAAQTAAGDEDGPLTKYAEPIEVTFVRSTDDTLENNVLSKISETIDNNRWTKLIQDTLNIKVKYLWIAKGSDQYTQKFNVAISTGEIPDVVQVDAIQLKQLADSDLLQDLQPVMDKYLSPLTKKIIDEAGDMPKKAATYSGKLLGLPIINADNEAAAFLWIRKDWLDKYSLKPPANMNDLMNIIKVFKEKIGDGAVPFAVQKDLWGGYAALEGFFNAYGAYPNIWIEKDGKLAFGSVQPEMKNALRVLAQMYKDGLIEKEFGVKDGGKVSEAAVAGKNGVYYGAQWNGLWPLQNNRNEDKTAEWRAYPIVSATEKPALTSITMGTSTWYAVNKNCKHPEAMVKLVNLYVDKTFDPQHQDYVTYSNPPGTEGVWKLSPCVMYTYKKNLDTWRAIQEPLKTGNPGSLFGEQLAMYENCKKFKDGDDTYWGWYRTFGDDGSWSVQDVYDKGNLYVMNKFGGAPTPTMVEKKATLDKMQNEFILKVIMGESSVDDFDKFVSDWMATGGQAMTDEVNQWYSGAK